MKKNLFLLFAIVSLGIFLRLYQLGQNPPSLDWDEASLGYNAYSLLKTGKDEFGRVWPVSIRSFEDYKPAGYTYSAIVPIALFGMSEFSVRLPSAVFGIFTVLLTYFLVIELGRHGLLYENSSRNEKLALLVSLFLTISPWHLQFSRVAFESNTALFWVMLGIVCFLKGLRQGIWFIFASVAFAFSFYFYHSPRLVVPLLIFGWTIYWFRGLWKQKIWIGMSIMLGVILLIPFAKEVMGSGRARLSSVTVINAQERLYDSITRIDEDIARGDLLGKLTHNRRMVYGLAILQGYLDHFNLDFLFLIGDVPDRHHAKDIGMLYIWEAPFILIGFWFLLTRKNWPIVWWYIVAPAASTITTGTPHAVRALLYLPLYQLFTAIGFMSFMHNIRKVRWTLLPLFTLIAINVFYYFNMYYIHTPIEVSQDWQYGFKEVAREAQKYESSVDKIIITYGYDQPHAFILFYQQIDPVWYQQEVMGKEVKRMERTFGKYEFRSIEWESDLQLSNTLIVGTPGEVPANNPNLVKEIKFLDGSVAFRVVKS